MELAAGLLARGFVTRRCDKKSSMSRGASSFLLLFLEASGHSLTLAGHVVLLPALLQQLRPDPVPQRVRGLRTVPHEAFLPLLAIALAVSAFGLCPI